MESLAHAKNHTIQGLSRISQFWGFPKAMGALFGALYLSAAPLSLDELVEQVGVTKGAVSTNIRQLERLGLVHKRLELGSRKDFYIAETDFWKIFKGILQERSKSEFDQALHTIAESLEIVDRTALSSPEEQQLARFYQKRLAAMQDFFNSLDRLVAVLLAWEDFKVNALERLLGRKEK